MNTKPSFSISKRLWLWVGAAAFAAVFSGSAAAAGIASTKHNLSSGSGNTNKGGTDQICVFCHTPHGADVSTAVPLWNKKLTPGAAYVTYDQLNTSSLDGKVLAVGSVSLACLSCHDGTQAMDNMVNAPGSGGYDVNAPRDGGGASWAGAAGGIMAGTPVPMLGLDLRNDHPIGIQYCGGGLSGSGTTVSGTCRDADFKAPLTASVNSNQIFWVDADSSAGSRGKGDIQLYTRTFGADGAGPSVECGSCHDPHADGGLFMRVSTAGSAICLACHVK